MRGADAPDRARPGAIPGATPSARTVASITPAASPRQPACAAATPAPESEASSTGRQSAVRMAQTRPGTAREGCVRVGAVRRAGPSRSARPCRAAGQPGGLRRQPRGRAQAAAILRHRLRRIPDVGAEIERLVGRRAHPAPAQVESARTSAGPANRAQASAIQTSAERGVAAWPRASARSAASSPAKSAGSGASNASRSPVAG